MMTSKSAASDSQSEQRRQRQRPQHLQQQRQHHQQNQEEEEEETETEQDDKDDEEYPKTFLVCDFYERIMYNMTSSHSHRGPGGVSNSAGRATDHDDSVSGLSVPLLLDDEDDGIRHHGSSNTADTANVNVLPHGDAGRWKAMREGARDASSPPSSGQPGTAHHHRSRPGLPSTIQERGETASLAWSNEPPDTGTNATPALLDLASTEALFHVCAIGAACTWAFLLAFGYSMTPTEDLVRVDDVERQAGATAAIIFFSSISLTILPMFLQRRPISTVVRVGLLIQLIAMTTNCLLAFAPTIVIRDPVTHAKVFYVRWCEWVPLSGLMTILSEGIDVRSMTSKKTAPSHRGAAGGPDMDMERIVHYDVFAVAIPIMLGLGQSLSCFCGLLLPFCPTELSWWLVMILSFVFYLPIFPRTWQKRKAYRDWMEANDVGRKNKNYRPTTQQQETQARLKFGNNLILTCSMCWTALVVIYFVVMAGKLGFPEGHILNNDSIAMVADTIFDVTAKFFYCKVIIEVHGQVFDPQARTQRQFEELRRIMNDLWETSKDVICILALRTETTNETTAYTTKATTMLSPAFEEMVVGNVDNLVARKDVSNKSKGPTSPERQLLSALTVEGIVHERTRQLTNCVVSRMPHSQNIPYPFLEAEKDFLDPDQLLFKEAVSLSSALCQLESNGRDNDDLIVHNIHTLNEGSVRRCELQVNNAPDTQAVIAIVRDVTERYRRHEAERRAHEETMNRQQDAQKVNRFTRHEIKNGLLAGIEMCDAMRTTIGDAPNGIKPQGNSNGVLADNEGEGPPCDNDSETTPTTTMARHLMDLEGTLHEILDTVLAEATARDVIHEAYEPKLEPLDIRDELFRSIGSAVNLARFPVTVSPHDMPRLQMDPQLLRYIHRNAISNAVKYGKSNGIIRTEVRYSTHTRVFELDVINQPGAFHKDLVAMGPAATRAVFLSRTRLHNSSADTRNGDYSNSFGNVDRLSSGDGAWIMEKCAKTLGGYCQIQFEPLQTVFSFRCQLDSCATNALIEGATFQVPDGTWGLAVDDSVIQRRLMSRILSHVGIAKDRQILLGADPDEAETLEQVMTDILANHPDDLMVALVDENLDYVESHGKGLLGSKLTQRALGTMPPSSSDRLLALIRSANDAASDIAMYNSRTHGFFPKASMTKDRVRASLAPLWQERFNKNVTRRAESIRLEFPANGAAGEVNEEKASATDGNNDDDGDDEDDEDDENDMITKQELRFSFAHVKSFIEQMDPATTEWIMIWRHLHSLSGDLLAAGEDIEPAGRAAELIHSMRGTDFPMDLTQKWEQIVCETKKAIEMLPEVFD